MDREGLRGRGVPGTDESAEPTALELPPRSAREAARRSRLVVEPSGVPGRVLVAVCSERVFLRS